MNAQGSDGTTRGRAKRPRGGATKAQQAARRKFIAESPVKPSRVGMEVIHRELVVQAMGKPSP